MQISEGKSFAFTAMLTLTPSPALLYENLASGNDPQISQCISPLSHVREAMETICETKA